MFEDLRHRLRALLWRERVEADLDEELRQHEAREVDALIARGLPREMAVRRARLDIGGADQIKEEHRDARGTRLVEDAWRDARVALRMLRRTPVFAATAIVTLALGVGVNTLVYSVVRGLVLRPLPIAEPDHVWQVQRGPAIAHSFPMYRALRDDARSFAHLAGFRITMMQVDTPSGPTHSWGYLATGSYFDLLGVTPSRGRFFTAADDAVPGASPFAVLSYDFWQTAFGGRDDIVGATVRVNRQPFTVLGIAPRDFHGTEVFYRPDLWVPMMMQAQIEVGNPWLESATTQNTWVIGRLASGVSTAQAAADLGGIAQRVVRETGGSTTSQAIRLTRPGLIGDGIGGMARTFGLSLLALAGLVLVAACANLAGTLTARGTDRQRELATRIAVGAARGRLLRQLLTETLVVVGLGGAIGVLGAWAAAQALSRWRLPMTFPVQFDVMLDTSVLAFAAVACVVTAIATGLSPAFAALRADPHASLRTRDGAGSRRVPVRDLLVTVQVAICVVLLGASLLAGLGLTQALRLPLGLDPQGVTIASVDLGTAGYSPTAGDALRRGILERLGAYPGVQHVAYGNSVPLSLDQSTASIYVDGREALPSDEPHRAVSYQVSPGYFQTLGIRLRDGRDVSWQDTAERPPVAVVNEAFVRQVFPGEAPLGRHVRLGRQGVPVMIVGVVDTGKYRSLTEEATPAIFRAMLQAPNTTTVIAVRSTRPDGEISGVLRDTIRQADAALPVFGLRPLADLLGFVRLPMQVAALALGLFGGVAVVLSATGIYGVVAYAVARRQRELAIRVAVGASRRSVVQLVLSRTACLVGAGLVLGVGAAIAVRGVLSSVVYAPVGGTAWVWPVVVGLVVLVATAASAWPVRRALRIAPVSALAVE